MKKKELFIILLLLIFSIPAILPLTHHGFFQTDDGEWMIIRLSAFYQALHDGQFPVRFLQRLNLGYGYPVAEFLYPGSFYLGSALHIIRFGFVNSIKGVIGISLVGSLIFTYFWLNKIFSKLPSFMGSLIALYLPYHLYDVYKRGSVGEIFALMWVPFILWQIERESFFFTTVGIAFLIIAHNTLAALLLPLIACALARKVYKNKKQTIYYYIYTLLISFGLSAFFWLPIPFELQNTVFSSTTVSQWSNYFATIDQIGIVSYLVLFMTLIIFTSRKVRQEKHLLTIIFFVISVISIFMATAASSLLWKIIPSNFIQFPFRFLSVIVVTLPFLAAFVLSFLKEKWQRATALVVLLVLIYSALPFSKPVSYFDKGEGYYYTNDATTTVQDEYMPVWVKQKPLKSPGQKVVLEKGRGLVKNLQQTNNSLSFDVSLKKVSTVRINILYWPGWHATVDNKNIPIFYSNPQGVMTVKIPAGNHSARFSFGENTLRLTADMLSFLTFILLVFFSVRKRIKLKKK